MIKDVPSSLPVLSGIKGKILLLTRLVLGFLVLLHTVPDVLKIDTSIPNVIVLVESYKWNRFLIWVITIAALMLVLGWYTRYVSGFLLIIIAMNIIALIIQSGYTEMLEREVLLFVLLLVITRLGPGEAAMDTPTHSIQ